MVKYIREYDKVASKGQHDEVKSISVFSTNSKVTSQMLRIFQTRSKYFIRTFTRNND